MISTCLLSHAQEICGNGIDDDGNGLIDCYDPACYSSPPPDIHLYLPDNYCDLDTALLLQALPAGGLFSGDGVSGSYLNPAHAGPGIHTISYTITQGACSYIKDTIVTIHAFPIADAGNDTIVCIGSPVILGSDSIPTANYLWLPLPFNGPIYSQLAQPVATNNTIGIYNYLMYVFRNGCNSTDTVQVTVTNAGNANAQLDWMACTLDTVVQFHGTPSGGVWRGHGVIDSVMGYYSPSQVGVGVFAVTYNTQNPCPATDTMLITVLGLANISLTTDTTVCIGEPIQLHVAGGHYITWEPPLYLDDPTIANPVSSTTTDITYAVTVFNDSTCPNTDSVHITVLQPPVAGFTITSACEGSESIITDLAQPAGLSYNWHMGNGTAINDTISSYTYANGGAYVVTQIVNNGVCADTAYDQVNIDHKPIADFTVDNACEGVQTFINDLSQAQGGDYTWHMGDGTTVNDTIDSYLYSNAGSYEVTQVINLGACADTAVQYVLISDVPLADFDYSFVDSQTVAFSNTSQGGNSWEWLYGDGSGSNNQNPQHHYNNPGSYNVWLVAVNNAGCSDSATQVIVIPNKPDTASLIKDAIYIPNAFSPNGDGNNDVWQVYTNASIAYFSLSIYNRWGEKVYESNDNGAGWDGRYKAQLQNPQSFVYTLSVVLQHGERRAFKGSVLLMK